MKFIMNSFLKEGVLDDLCLKVSNHLDVKRSGMDHLIF